MGLRTFGTQLKALVLKELFLPRMMGSWGSLFLGSSRTHYNYSADVGDGLTSSVVMPTVQWLMRTFPEAPLVVRRREADELEIVDGHPLVQLVDRPNDFYPGSLLWMATLLDWCWWGESYWRILFERGGRPGELWWMAPWSCEPKWPQDGSVFISHYDYHPDVGTTVRLEREEVLHFRHGIDPRNPRHGLPPLRAILQDIWVDLESNNFVGSMLRNMGIPGMILSPKGEATLSPDDVEYVKAYIQSRFTGDQRGLPLALGSPTDVQKLSSSPTELDLSTWRTTAETRVPAALGIPSAVIGFYTGLDATKVGATMREYVRLGWNNGIVPVQRLLAGELQRVLLPYFEENPDGFLVSWNYDEVQALEEDGNALAKRAVDLYQGGVLMRSEARQIMGYEANDGDKIYLVPSSMKEEGPDAPEPEPLPAPALPVAAANGNGNGNGARNGAVAVQQRSLKQGNLDEWLTEQIGRTARRIDHPPPASIRLAVRLTRQQAQVQKRFEPIIRQVFHRYADAAGTAAREVLQPQKASVENVIRTAIVHERLPLAQIRFELEGVYRELYQAMFDMLMKTLTEMDHPELTDPARVQRTLQLAAGQRAGLLDLTSEARSAILDSLEQATAAGLSEDAMVAAIRDSVPRGRWQSIETRAQTIARTESRYSLNMASSGYARDQGLRMLVLDARLGPSDDVCEMRNGFIVTPAQAEAISGSEHPNGTLAVLPLPMAATVEAI